MINEVQDVNNNTQETVDNKTSTVSTVIETPKRRGRKPNPNKKIYFGQEEEQAFVEYVNSNDQFFRDKIFAEKLYYPFTKMIESMIRRYNLFTPDEDFEDTFFDTMSFLITKINNFDTSKNKKAYSYCGTICKNYLIFKRNQYSKRLQKHVSYDVVFPTTDSDKRVDISQEKITMEFNTKLINNTITQLEDFLNSNKKDKLTTNEHKIGNALLFMLKNWEDIFNFLGSKKFNKSCVLQYMKDCTDLTTKEIREGMKVYKNLYIFTKQKLISQ